MNVIDLSGRRAVVTGGSRGIGRAVIDRLLASGARTIIWDIAGGGEDFLHVDVTKPASVAAAATETASRLGGIDILVNCAGIAGERRAIEEYPVEEWNHILDVNLNGTFLTCRAVVPHMRAGGYGRIVNLASIAGKEGNPFNGAYSASKAAVIALTKSLGKELVGTNILVNCLAPAAIATDLFRNMSEKGRRVSLSRIPLGRAGKAEEVAAFTAWLASEECSFSTGAVFDLSGGRATY